MNNPIIRQILRERAGVDPGRDVEQGGVERARGDNKQQVIKIIVNCF